MGYNSWQMRVVFEVAGVPMPTIDEDQFFGLQSQLSSIELDIIRQLGDVGRELANLDRELSSEAIAQIHHRWQTKGHPALFALAETIGVLENICYEIGQAILQFKADMTVAVGAIASGQVILAVGTGGLSLLAEKLGWHVIESEARRVIQAEIDKFEAAVLNKVADGLRLDDLANEIARRADAAIRAAIEDGMFLVGEQVAASGASAGKSAGGGGGGGGW